MLLQTYDPTIEDAYRKQLVVDNKMCFVEVIDTAGQGAYIAAALPRASGLSVRLQRNTPRCVINGSGTPLLASTLHLNTSADYFALSREGQGFILVYSIASRSTFDRLEIFRASMRKVKRGDPIFVLVGNKCDKSYEREVSREEGAALARQFGCEFIETSAKTALNVERLFMNLVRSLRNTRTIEPGTPGNAEAPGGKKPKKKGCPVF